MHCVQASNLIDYYITDDFVSCSSSGINVKLTPGTKIQKITGSSSDCKWTISFPSATHWLKVESPVSIEL